MSRDIYMDALFGAKLLNAHIYPSYDTVNFAKTEGYPEGIQISKVAEYICRPLHVRVNLHYSHC